ncbi:DPY30 domain-containing protein 1-like [Lineus longissimus]|uniref:DPY30 domain-containing protein 1-like n=1 Tax=Lineus longissimus TaxID=88925 RepID=UPI002B4DC9B9
MMMDSKYLEQQVGVPLSKCLAEVIQHRPIDPIEFMANWLKTYRQNVLFAEKMEVEAAQLAKEHEDYAREMVMQEKRRAEVEQLRKEEEEKQKALEAQLAAQKMKQDSNLSAPNLPPLPEGEEPSQDETAREESAPVENGEAAPAGEPEAQEQALYFHESAPVENAKAAPAEPEPEAQDQEEEAEEEES